MPTYSNMFVALSALRNLDKQLDPEPFGTEKYHRLKDQIDGMETAIDANLPSGSGFDSGCEIVYDTDTRVVIDAPYHHMNMHGVYDGWVLYKVIISTTFTGPSIDVKVKGYDNTARKYADDSMRDYVAEVFSEAFNRPVIVD